MWSTFKPAALVLAIVALLTFAPAALASHGGDGGGGGGGGACATIDSFNVVAGAASITWSAVTTNNCIDEFAGATAFDFSNSATGLTGRSVSVGRSTLTSGSTFAATPGVKYTITVSLYTPSGKLVTSQTKSATALAAGS